MLAGLLAALGLTIPALPASAVPAGTYVPRRVHVAPHGGFSHVIYMNDCRPGGCIVVPGDDDSRSNRSSIPQMTSQLDAWPHGDAEWDELVRCVRETYAPFDIQIVTDDPGQASHFEVFVGGDPEDLQFSDALGVAPFIPCGGIQDNVPTFVFANVDNRTDVLCWAVAQETAHAFGLDHVLLRDDPMTYLTPPYRKRFQNQAGSCGETMNEPRECFCGDASQNSYAFLSATFGASNLPAPGVVITSPHAGAWVVPGAPVSFTVDSLLAMQEVALAVDGATTSSLGQPPFAFNLPLAMTPGPHQVRVRAVDQRGLEGQAEVNVVVLGACGGGTTCGSGTVCLGGVCLPDASQPGGLGATCETPVECGSGQCTATAENGAACTAPCDDGRRCPGGFTCAGDGVGVCWPAGESGGCGAGGTGGGGGGWIVILGLTLAAGGRARTRARTRARAEL